MTCRQAALRRMRWWIMAAPAIAACLANPARAATPDPAPAARRVADAVDPLSLIEGNADAWSVSRTEAGCYLLSPYRRGSSRLAIGRHPTLGLGLFAVGFALAMPATNVNEPVVIQANGEEHTKAARLVANKLIFIPLTPAEADGAVQELRESGALWLMVRQIWVVHGGMGVQAGIAAYAAACAVTQGADTPAPVANAPVVGRDGG